ncbi:MAG TPA: alpha/beta fold hydrolase [Gaiellaceae bacterium]|nr:alpha/beta fold hydrolase [Gaiellaceae bacterium]
MRGRKHAVFLAAVALLALHVLDDGFLQPEPGTSAGDHVLYVAVFLAAFAFAAAVYGRAPAGFRAALAFLFGVVALTYGAMAVGEARGQGLAGHDYTGLLLLPAGVALLVVAVLELWRSRRTGGSRGRRWGRRALLALAAVVFGFLVVLPVALAILTTHRPRVVVEAADLGRPHEEVTITTEDGLDLAGWYVPSENGAAVIVFPGRTSRVPHARLLADAGYGVLMVDMRGQGESEGDPNLLGWDSPKDLAAAIDFLRARPDVEEGRIGGIGFSVGGEQMIQAAAENEALRAVVSEGAGERSWRETSLQPNGGWPGIAEVAVWNAVVAVISGDAPPPSLEDLVAEISPRPLFLIHARHGQGGENLNPVYFEAAGEPKELWEITTGGHTEGLASEGEEYERRVLGFFDDALAGRR